MRWKKLSRSKHIEEAMAAAQAIGDSTLQRKAGGQVIEDSFTPSYDTL